MRPSIILSCMALSFVLGASGQDISTFAGGGPNGVAPLAANLASPDAVAIDPNNSGVYYIAVGAQHRIFKVA
ncbi:MAG TPA: hypothetical protein VEU62_23130, partial [Bryobacterales bacterium]|nr:hypothetical protein [Bryobacterales bacterium]